MISQLNLDDSKISFSKNTRYSIFIDKLNIFDIFLQQIIIQK